VHEEIRYYGVLRGILNTLNQETHFTIQCTLEQGLTQFGPWASDISRISQTVIVYPIVTNFYMEMFCICYILGE
jgi:hypothetical protein